MRTPGISSTSENELYSWEPQLLAKASLAGRLTTAVPRPLSTDTAELKRAYDHCKAITAEHSRTFFLASSLLPGEKRRAARALYAFCRHSDDLVDHPDAHQQDSFYQWERRIRLPEPIPGNLISLAWADTRRRFAIPDQYIAQFIEGISTDIVRSRYARFAELADYCYGVAATVGLMAMHIIGYSDDRAVGYAIRLGVALQLTNILRDVREDWLRGRLYLPAEELAAFQLTEADIADQVIDARWRAFMRFQIDRTRLLYTQGLRGVALLHPQGRFAINAAGELYRAILDDIAAHDYDVFSRRAFVSKGEKLRRLPGIYWRAQQYR